MVRKWSGRMKRVWKTTVAPEQLFLGFRILGFGFLDSEFIEAFY